MTESHRHFQDELDELKGRLVHMAGLAEERVAKAVGSLLNRDTATAHEVVERDSDIDALEMEIDERALQLLARQQPMARDLRFIAMAMKIGNDLERVGDHAVNIAENVHFIVEQPAFPPLPEIEEMVRLASKMLNDALDSFVGADPGLARDVLGRDDRVDELHENVFRILLTYMMDDPRRINPALDMLLDLRATWSVSRTWPRTSPRMSCSWSKGAQSSTTPKPAGPRIWARTRRPRRMTPAEPFVASSSQGMRLCRLTCGRGAWHPPPFRSIPPATRRRRMHRRKDAR